MLSPLCWICSTRLQGEFGRLLLRSIVVQVLQFVFYKAAARSASTRARSLFGNCRSGATASCMHPDVRLVIRDRRLHFFADSSSALFFFEQIPHALHSIEARRSIELRMYSRRLLRRGVVPSPGRDGSRTSRFRRVPRRIAGFIMPTMAGQCLFERSKRCMLPALPFFTRFPEFFHCVACTGGLSGLAVWPNTRVHRLQPALRRAPPGKQRLVCQILFMVRNAPTSQETWSAYAWWIIGRRNWAPGNPLFQRPPGVPLG